MIRTARLLALAASTAIAFAVTAANAAESKVTVVNLNTGNATDAMKVVRDKDTGKIRAADADEIAAMGNSRLAPNIVTLSRPVTSMVERADGSVTIRRSLDDLDSLVVERGTDGRMSMRHGAKDAPKSSTTAPKE